MMSARDSMNRLRAAFARVFGAFSKRRRDRDLEEELRTHLDALIEEKIRRGMNPQEARQAARREFGGVEQTKEAYRDQRGLPALDTLLQDVKFAVRGLRLRLGFAAVAILTLALGIGATTAVFTVVDRILFRSLPYPEDNRLVSFGVMAPFDTREFMLGPDFVEWRPRQQPFETITAIEPGSVDCDLTEQNPSRLSCGQVDSAFLPTFCVQPILGRNFTHEEDLPNGPRAVLLSYGFWRSRFAGDPQIVGKNLSLDGKSTFIVGVLPAEFEMPTLARADLLVPLAMGESTDRGPDARQHVVRTFARLKPGVSSVQAAAMLQPLFEESLNYVPVQFRKEVSLRVRSLRDRQVGDSRQASWILLGAVFAVLLVACTNVANLILARATARQREFAVRVALGATRARLIRQALTETLVLGMLGGSAGCFVAYLLLRLFVSIAPDGIPYLQQASLDLRVILFTLGVSLLSGILFGIASAFRRTAPELLAGKESHAASRNLLRQTLVTAQIAASLILLAGAGLLLRSFWKLQSVPLGMNTESILTAEINLADYRYPQPAQQLEFFRDLLSRLARIPGVSALALSDTLPPSGGMQATFLSAIEVAGQPKFTAGTGGMIGYRYITPAYFSALGIRVERGRTFSENDLLSADNPVILSEALAKRLFAEGDPIGKPFRFGRQDRWRTIVGIVGDVKNDGLAAAGGPEFYLPWKEEPEGYYRRGSIILRTPMNPKAIAKWVRSEAASIDPTVPVTIEAMSQRVEKLADRPRFNAILLSLFAAMGVLLAGIGIYGVVGFLVAQQTREIGVRMALGASPQNILRMVLSSVARWTLGGAVLGILGAWFCTRLLESLLFEVKTHDPVLLCGAVLLLLAAAFVAAWIPARRAMRVDPMVALRYE
ncbi:MAG: ABC transporter permease [Candidatus Acidiferrum sp.]|jgi:putative ABC transport system permease protein